MTTFASPEYRSGHERSPNDGNRSEHAGTGGLGNGMIERFLTERLGMLHSIQDALTPQLYEALNNKIRYEHDSLLSLAAEAAKEREREEAHAHELPSQYFIRKRLAEGIF